MAHVGEVQFLARAGRYLVTGQQWNQFSFPAEPVDVGPVDHPSSVFQLVPARGAAQLVADADQQIYADVQLSSDGRCVVYTTQNGVRVLDVETLHTFDPFGARWMNLSWLGWIEPSAQ